MSDERVEIVDWEKQAGIPQPDVAIEPQTLDESVKLVAKKLTLGDMTLGIVGAMQANKKALDWLNEGQGDFFRALTTEKELMQVLFPGNRFMTAEQMVCELDARLRRVELALATFLGQVGAGVSRGLEDIAREALVVLSGEEK